MSTSRTIALTPAVQEAVSAVNHPTVALADARAAVCLLMPVLQKTHWEQLSCLDICKNSEKVTALLLILIDSSLDKCDVLTLLADA